MELKIPIKNRIFDFQFFKIFQKRANFEKSLQKFLPVFLHTRGSSKNFFFMVLDVDRQIFKNLHDKKNFGNFLSLSTFLDLTKKIT